MVVPRREAKNVHITRFRRQVHDLTVLVKDTVHPSELLKAQRQQNAVTLFRKLLSGNTPELWHLDEYGSLSREEQLQYATNVCELNNITLDYLQSRFGS